MFEIKVGQVFERVRDMGITVNSKRGTRFTIERVTDTSAYWNYGGNQRQHKDLCNPDNYILISDAPEQATETKKAITEPPKSVCVGVKTIDCAGPQALRHTVKNKSPFMLCERHYLHAEASLILDSKKSDVNIFMSTDVPERLPKAALAVDWYEDCL